MTKERLSAVLVKALVVIYILLLAWQLISISSTIWSIDQNLDSIETQVAPGGKIDDSLRSIDETLSSIETQIAPDP